MSRNSNNSVLKDIQTEERLEKRLEKIAKAKAKTCHSKEDREINSNGYKYGYEGLSIPEEFKDNGVFISGYERGKRTKKIEDYLKNKKIVEQMVKDNIPLEDAPDYIKNDKSLADHYKLCQLRTIPKETKIKK